MNWHLAKGSRLWGLRHLSHLGRDWLRKVRRSGRDFMDRLLGPAVKLPVIAVVNAVRHAAPGLRTRVFRRSVSFLFRTRLPAPPAVWRINVEAEFESGFSQLAAMLGQAGKSPSPGEVEFLASIPKRRKYYPGTIDYRDALFLNAFVSILAPRRVLEIGTLGGFSAGIMAAALARRRGNCDTSWVDTIDVSAQCATDQTRPTGFEITESFPELVSMIHLHIPADSGFVAQLARRDELELAFIDADHRHPFPLLDLLRLAPYVRGDGWILLHDIDFGTMTRQAIAVGQPPGWEPVYGAEWLFNHWPFGKIKSCSPPGWATSGGGNIGAVQLPRDKSALIPFALRLMAIPFEIRDEHARSTRRVLYESLGKLISV
jgi:Methyltransferase domain